MPLYLSQTSVTALTSIWCRHTKAVSTSALNHRESKNMSALATFELAFIRLGSHKTGGSFGRYTYVHLWLGADRLPASAFSSAFTKRMLCFSVQGLLVFFCCNFWLNMKLDFYQSGEDLDYTGMTPFSLLCRIHVITRRTTFRTFTSVNIMRMYHDEEGHTLQFFLRF